MLPPLPIQYKVATLTEPLPILTTLDNNFTNLFIYLQRYRNASFDEISSVLYDLSLLPLNTSSLTQDQVLNRIAFRA